MKRGCLRVISLTSDFLRYAPSVQLQERLVAERKAGTAPDTVLLVQHHPVFTVGKRGTDQDFLTSKEELARLGIDVVAVPRGGETTYHGPGQLVGYPILDLRQLGLGARAFVEGLEDAMVQTVGCFGIQARGRVPGKTGVWVGERKIGAVGVRITHGISSHGIALNVTTDLRAYQHIVPCGTPDKEMTSVLQELQRPGQMHSSSSRVTNSSFLVDHAAGLTGVHQSHQRGQQQQLQTTGGAGAALMLAAEACLVSALARMTNLDVVTN